MSIVYDKIQYTGELPDGRVITQIISDPKGITLAEHMTCGEAMFRAFKDNVTINGTYKKSILR